MKKRNILIVLSIIIILINIVNSWFHDELMEKFWIIWFLVDLIIFFVFIICCVCSINYFKKNSKNLLDKLPIIILSLNFIMILAFIQFNPLRTIKIRYELKVFEKYRYEVIELVKNNELVLDLWNSKTAKLPRKYKKISISGDIIVYKNDDEGIVIGFWVVRGIPHGSIEVVYSSETETLIKNNVDYLIKTKKLKNHWYYVVRN